VRVFGQAIEDQSGLTVYLLTLDGGREWAKSQLTFSDDQPAKGKQSEKDSGASWRS